VFTDGADVYIPNNLKKAMTIAKQYNRDCGCVRVYEQTEWDEDEGIFEDGDCIISHGHFPN